MEIERLLYAAMPVYETWSATNELVWADDGSGTPWLAKVWRCHENGKLDYKPLPMVKLPSPQQQEMK